MKIVVQVVYALPGAQEVVEVELEQGAPVEDAINASGIAARHPEIDLKTQRTRFVGAAGFAGHRYCATATGSRSIGH